MQQKIASFSFWLDFCWFDFNWFVFIIIVEGFDVELFANSPVTEFAEVDQTFSIAITLFEFFFRVAHV